MPEGTEETGGTGDVSIESTSPDRVKEAERVRQNLKKENDKLSFGALGNRLRNLWQEYTTMDPNEKDAAKQQKKADIENKMAETAEQLKKNYSTIKERAGQRGGQGSDQLSQFMAGLDAALYLVRQGVPQGLGKSLYNITSYFNIFSDRKKVQAMQEAHREIMRGERAAYRENNPHAPAVIAGNLTSTAVNSVAGAVSTVLNTVGWATKQSGKVVGNIANSTRQWGYEQANKAWNADQNDPKNKTMLGYGSRAMQFLGGAAISGLGAVAQFAAVPVKLGGSAVKGIGSMVTQTGNYMTDREEYLTGQKTWWDTFTKLTKNISDTLSDAITDSPAVEERADSVRPA